MSTDLNGDRIFESIYNAVDVEALNEDLYYILVEKHQGTSSHRESN